MLSLLSHSLHREVDSAISTDQPTVPNVSTGVEIQSIKVSSATQTTVTFKHSFPARIFRGKQKTMGDMNIVRQELFTEVGRIYKETKTIPDNVLSALHFVFPGGSLVQAMDLVEKQSVSRLASPSGRDLYQVIGSTGTPYMCFTTSEFCSCYSYRYAVLKKSEHAMCKHVLAIRLSEAMGLTKYQEVSDQEVSNIIKNMD